MLLRPQKYTMQFVTPIYPDFLPILPVFFTHFHHFGHENMDTLFILYTCYISKESYFYVEADFWY